MRELPQATQLSLGADPRFVTAVIHEHAAFTLKGVDDHYPEPGEL